MCEYSKKRNPKFIEVDFSEHIVGYKQGQFLSERPEKYAHNTKSVNNSHLRCFRKTDNDREKHNCNIFQQRKSKIATANSPEKSSPLLYEE